MEGRTVAGESVAPTCRGCRKYPLMAESVFPMTAQPVEMGAGELERGQNEC